MNKKTLIWLLSYLLVIILFYVNIGSFIVTDVTNDFDIKSFGAGVTQATGKTNDAFYLEEGDSLSWAQASNAQFFLGGGNLIIQIMIAAFWFSAFQFTKSYNRGKQKWKRIAVVISNFACLYLIYSLVNGLINCSGKVYWPIMPDNVYIYTFNTTETVNILYIAVAIFMVAEILFVVDGFKLFNKENN